MRFDLHTLQLFVAVLEAGSLGAASKREHIALSALSKRISDLERTVGTPLLLRHPRGVEPTLAGQALARGARTLLHTAEDLAQQMGDFSVGIRGHVRIVATASTIIEFLPRELEAFGALYPGVSVDLEENISDAIVEAISNNGADIGLYTQVDDERNLTTFAYHRNSLRLIVPIRHPLARRQEVAFAETLAYDYVGLHKGSSLNLLLTRAAAPSGATLKLRYQVTSFDAIVSMVRANLGIGVVPSGAADNLYALLPDVAVLRLTDPWSDRQSKICVRSVDTLSTAGRLLLDHLRASAEPQPQ